MSGAAGPASAAADGLAQPELPGIGRTYDGLAASRKRGQARLRRHLVLLAEAELAADEVPRNQRTYDRLVPLTREIYRRHWPADRRFQGVAERTIRDDAVCRRLFRSGRGWSTRRVPCNLAVAGMSLHDLMHAYALLEAKCARLEARLERGEDATVIGSIRNLLLKADVHGNRLAGADDPDPDGADGDGEPGALDDADEDHAEDCSEG